MYNVRVNVMRVVVARTGDDTADAGGVCEWFLTRVLGGPKRLVRLADDPLGVDGDAIALGDDGTGSLTDASHRRGVTGNGGEGHGWFVCVRECWIVRSVEVWLFSWFDVT